MESTAVVMFAQFITMDLIHRVFDLVYVMDVNNFRNLV